MDLAAYAEWGVRLVNTAQPDRDRLLDLAGLRDLLADRPHLAVRATRRDLAALRALRPRLRSVFARADAGAEAETVAALNGLLQRHPVGPQLTGHDGSAWHLHLLERGPAAERYAAAAVFGLAAVVAGHGVARLGLCAAPPCRNAYVDATTNAARRYCSTRCATRAHVAAYRARSRAAGSGGKGA